MRRLRKSQHDADRAARAADRWDAECEQIERKQTLAQLDKARKAAVAPIWDELKRNSLVKTFGGEGKGEAVADYLVYIDRLCRNFDHDVPPWTPPVPPPPADQTSPRHNQTKSGQIKPNQTKRKKHPKSDSTRQPRPIHRQNHPPNNPRTPL